MTEKQVREAIEEEITNAAVNGTSTCARYWDWSGIGDEKDLLSLIVSALRRLGMDLE